MRTEILKIDGTCDEEKINRAGEIVRNGGIVAFPTETVYGLGGDAFNKLSSKKIYEAKGRPSDNPLIVHVGRKEDIKFLTKEINDNAKKLIDEFFPGPLTLIMKKSDDVPYETTGGLDSVGVRMPKHEIARQFIIKAGGFVAAPSANISGRPSPTMASHVREDLDGKIDAIIDDTMSIIGLESTIVDTTVTPVEILRPGYITKEDIERVLGECNYDKALIGNGEVQKVKAPGMKYKHYAPKAELSIVKGEADKVVKEIIERANKHIKDNKKVAIIASEENASRYLINSDFSLVGSDDVKPYSKCLVFSIGSKNKGDIISKNLYKILRGLDEFNVEIAYSEDFSYVARSGEKNGDFGIAIMNRLKKAAGNKIITLPD